MKLTECLPEIINIDSDIPEEVDITKTNFQRFSCSIEAASKIYSHRVDSLHDLALYFNKSLTGNEEHENSHTNEGESERGEQVEDSRTINYRRSIKSCTIEEDETKLNKSLKDIVGIYTDPMFIHMHRNLKGTGKKKKDLVCCVRSEPNHETNITIFTKNRLCLGVYIRHYFSLLFYLLERTVHDYDR